jgi:Dehydrogenases with different specificities (related to short-chain alcohol dehydrogenases)
MANHSIKGKTVLIAGGAKNLGGLIARDLAEQGAKAVVIHYNSAASKAEAEKPSPPFRPPGRKASRCRPISPPRARSKSCSPMRSPPSVSRISPSIPSAKC